VPLYPYRCTQCGHRFEKIQSFNSEPEKTCPQCGGALERLLTAPGLQFKGAGWYVNDYASKSGGGSSSDSGESKASAESKSSAESKPGATSTDSSSTSAAPSSTPKPSAPSSSGSKD
jgi:putative FmdB family regulatory protein